MGTADAVTDRGRASAADHHHPVIELHRHLDRERRDRPGPRRHPVAHDGAEPGQGERHVVGAGRQRADREPAGVGLVSVAEAGGASHKT